MESRQLRYFVTLAQAMSRRLGWLVTPDQAVH
jgi:hypothetical protein